jgi:hypothetical protein
MPSLAEDAGAERGWGRRMSSFWNNVEGLLFGGSVIGVSLTSKIRSDRRFEAAKADFSNDDYERFAFLLSNKIYSLSTRQNKPVDLRTFVEAQPYIKSPARDFHYNQIVKRVLACGIIDRADLPPSEGRTPVSGRYLFILNDLGWFQKLEEERQKMGEQARPAPTTINNNINSTVINGGTNIGNIASPGAVASTSQSASDRGKFLQDLMRSLYAEAEKARTPEEKERAVELADDLRDAVKADDSERTDKMIGRIKKFTPVATSVFDLTKKIVDSFTS